MTIWAEPLLGRTLAGRYRLEEILGHGGTAVVLRGTHTWTERPVAVKVLHTDLAAKDPTLAKRFLREAKAAASLRHRNVVDVLDMGEEDGLAFLVLELLQGEDLSVRLARDGRLDVETTLEILAPVIDAMHAVHARGFVHRDVKAENIFLHADEGALIPKLLDFGTVRSEDPLGDAPLTATGALLGTPEYMSPEQVTGKPLTPAADQFALGVLAYRALTGAFPFTGETMVEMLANTAMTPAPSLAGVASIPPGVGAAIDRALAKDPAARFESAHALLEALLEGAREVGLEVADPRAR